MQEKQKKGNYALLDDGTPELNRRVQCSTRHVSQQRPACESSNEIGKRKSLTKRSLSASLLTQSRKENTTSVKLRPMSQHNTTSLFNREIQLTYEPNMVGMCLMVLSLQLTSAIAFGRRQ